MIAKLKEIIIPILQKEDTELIDIIYRREARRQVLRLLVDKDGGITLSDCVRLNKSINQVLDEGNVITGYYLLEVDSPGIGRWFDTRHDYERAKERLVRVTLKEAILDKKEYIGRLKEVLDDSIKVEVKKKGIIDMPYNKIVRTRQEVEF